MIWKFKVRKNRNRKNLKSKKFKWTRLKTMASISYAFHKNVLLLQIFHEVQNEDGQTWGSFQQSCFSPQKSLTWTPRNRPSWMIPSLPLPFPHHRIRSTTHKHKECKTRKINRRISVYPLRQNPTLQWMALKWNTSSVSD